MKYRFLFNPLAGKGKAEQLALKLDTENPQNTKCLDMTNIDFKSFLVGLDNDEALVICGGDGTLNSFLNKTADIEIKNDILYYPAGSGNDFAKDLDRTPEEGQFKINKYINDLPTVRVKDKEYRFINGVGFGIDGLVCAEGNRLRNKGKRVNYTVLAVKCLAYLFKPVNATVTADGVTKEYKRVWMTTTMKGKYFGGGMKITPNQDRDSGKISVLVAHNLSRIKILTLFPSIFNGKHIKYTDNIDIFVCEEISVKYDRPCAMQIDGEPTFGVTEYTATAKQGVTVK